MHEEVEKRARLLGAVALTFLTGCSGADAGSVACTDMGCEDGLSVDFSLTEPGDYTVEIVADGQTITCSATLPLPPCDRGGASCSAPGVLLMASGCALPASNHSLGGVMLSGAHPETVEVVVSRDGNEERRQSFTPTYQRVAPNGEACGPICNQATVTLSP